MPISSLLPNFFNYKFWNNKYIWNLKIYVQSYKMHLFCYSFNKQFLFIIGIYSFSIREGGGKKSWASHPQFGGNNQHLGTFKKIDTWAIRLVEHQVPPFEFYFEKNGIENMVP